MSESKIDTKTRDFVEQLVVTSGFAKNVRKTSAEKGIPQKGYDIAELDDLIVKEVYPRIPDTVLDKKRYSVSITSFLSYYGLSYSWFDFFSDYILFGFWDEIEIKPKRQIFLIDIGDKCENPKIGKKLLDLKPQLNPVVILIPPTASQRDIDDFIKNNWAGIEKMQKKYRKYNLKLVNTRRKNSRVKNRDRFIFKNRKLTKKALVSKVADEFGDILDFNSSGLYVSNSYGRFCTIGRNAASFTGKHFLQWTEDWSKNAT